MSHMLFPDTGFDERLHSLTRKILWSGIVMILLGAGTILIPLVATRFAPGLVAALMVLACEVRLIPDWLGMQPSGIPGLVMAILIMIARHEISVTTLGIHFGGPPSAPARAICASRGLYDDRTGRTTGPY